MTRLTFLLNLDCVSFLNLERLSPQWGGGIVKLSFERRIQRLADRLEANPGKYGLANLDLSQVMEAVESLEGEGHALDRILEREELIAEKIRSAAPSAPL